MIFSSCKTKCEKVYMVAEKVCDWLKTYQMWTNSIETFSLHKESYITVILND